MSDVANVNPDLCAISIGGSEYFAAKITITGLVGAMTYIMPTSIGQVIGALQGEYDVRCKAVLVESTPAQVRAFLGFDGSGTDFNRKAGVAVPTLVVKVWDPADTGKLKQIIFPTAILVDHELDSDGQGLREVPLEFRAVSNAAGEVFSIGPGT